MSPRFEAETYARAHGGWFIYREGAVYRASNDDEFLRFCRDGLVHPRDEVFVITANAWRSAAAVPLAGLVFPAHLIFAPAPRRDELGGWPFLLLLFLSMSIIDQLRQIAISSSGRLVGDVVGAALLVGTLYVPGSMSVRVTRCVLWCDAVAHAGAETPFASRITASAFCCRRSRSGL